MTAWRANFGVCTPRIGSEPKVALRRDGAMQNAKYIEAERSESIARSVRRCKKGRRDRCGQKPGSSSNLDYHPHSHWCSLFPPSPLTLFSFPSPPSPHAIPPFLIIFITTRKSTFTHPSILYSRRRRRLLIRPRRFHPTLQTLFIILLPLTSRSCYFRISASVWGGQSISFTTWLAVATSLHLRVLRRRAIVASHPQHLVWIIWT